jgi:hypothetical protein
VAIVPVKSRSRKLRSQVPRSPFFASQMRHLSEMPSRKVSFGRPDRDRTDDLFDAMERSALCRLFREMRPASILGGPRSSQFAGTTATPCGLVSLGSWKTTGETDSATVPSSLTVRTWRMLPWPSGIDVLPREERA